MQRIRLVISFNHYITHLMGILLNVISDHFRLLSLSFNKLIMVIIVKFQSKLYGMKKQVGTWDVNRKLPQTVSI